MTTNDEIVITQKKLYVLITSLYSDMQVRGVFSTVEAAHDWYKTHAKFGNDGDVLYEWDEPALLGFFLDEGEKSEEVDDYENYRKEWLVCRNPEEKVYYNQIWVLKTDEGREAAKHESPRPL